MKKIDKEWTQGVHVKQVDEVLDRIDTVRAKRKEYLTVSISIDIEGNIAPSSKDFIKQIQKTVKLRESKKKKKLKKTLIKLGILLAIGIAVLIIIL